MVVSLHSRLESNKEGEEEHVMPPPKVQSPSDAWVDLGRIARGQTDRVQIQTLVLVVSILWGLHLPMGSNDNKYLIRLPPRYPTKERSRTPSLRR